MSYQTTRSNATLLIPSKRPLISLKRTNHSQPRTTSTSTSTSTTIKSNSKYKLTPSSESSAEERRTQATTVEYDLSRKPQPFLDPGLWENMKAVDRARREGEGSTGGGERVVSAKEREEEGRRKREREAEFGAMAVKGRMGRWR